MSVLRHAFSACRACDRGRRRFSHATLFTQLLQMAASAQRSRPLAHLSNAGPRITHVIASPWRMRSNVSTHSFASSYPRVETAYLLIHRRTGSAAKLPYQIHCSLGPLGMESNCSSFWLDKVKSLPFFELSVPLSVDHLFGKFHTFHSRTVTC